MSNVDTPPNPYFSGINFNSSFFPSLSAYLTEAIANSKYLRLIGGILRGNLGIKRTPITELDVNGKVLIDNTFATLPGNGTLGSNGTRLILWPGSVGTEPPFAFGINTSILWYGVPSTGNHAFFTGTNERMRIKSDGNVGIGTSDPQTSLHIRGSNPTNIRIQTNNALAGEITGIEFGIQGYTNANDFAKITSTTKADFKNILQFHTANGANTSTAKMTILENGNIGIGTNDPLSRLTLYSDYNNGEATGFTIDARDAINNYSLKLYPTLEGASAIGYNFRSRNVANILDVLTFRHNGNVGITNTNPANIFQVGSGARLRISNGPDDFSMIGTNNIDGASNSRIVINGSTRSVDAGDIHYRATAATGDHRFYTSETTERLTILNSGNIGIANNNPGNILQVGDSARLRISNGPTDYTTIGTKEVDDAANTCIYLSGNTRSGSPGNISHFATTITGEHRFFTNGSTTLANTLAILSPDKVRFYKPPRAMNCNYENEGILYPYTSGLVNTGGTTLGGYFLPVNEYTNSLMVCAFSHGSTSYTYWRGHVSIGNSGEILAVSAPIAGSNLLVESFLQQGTLIPYIRVIPTISFSTSVLLRVKMYG